MFGSQNVVDTLRTTRSAVTNGSRLHARGIDGRTRDARRFRDLVHSFAESLGGVAALGEADKALVRTAASLTVRSERLQGDVVAGRGVDGEEMVRLANATARVMAALRAKHPPRDTTPNLADILAEHSDAAK